MLTISALPVFAGFSAGDIQRGSFFVGQKRPTYRLMATANGSCNFGEGIAYYSNHVYKTCNDVTPNRLLINWDVSVATAPSLKSFYNQKPNGPMDIAVLSTDGIKTYAYVAYYTNESSNTFRIFDVTDDTQWVEMGGASLTTIPLYAFEVAVSTDGTTVWLGFDQPASTNSVVGLDVTNKSTPTVVSSGFDMNNAARVNGLLLNGTTLYLTFENGTPNSYRQVNVSNRASPSLINTLSSNISSEPRESYLSGNYLFTGSYFETPGGMAIDNSIPGTPAQISALTMPNPTLSMYGVDNFIFYGLQPANSNDTFRVVDKKDPYHLSFLTDNWGNATQVGGIAGNGHTVYVGGRVTGFSLIVYDISDFY